VSERNVEILEAACRVIAQHGIGALRMQDVAREAGVSSALVHYYFATRADLLERVFDFAEARADARAMAEIAKLPTGAARLERLLLVYIEDESVFRDSWVLWVEMWRAAVFQPELRPPIVASYEAWLEQIAGLVREGQADGSIRADVDADEAAARLAAVVDKLGERRLLGALSTERAVGLIRGALSRELDPKLPDRSAA
jgi:AcrR family transcriptional regulator